MKEPRGLVRDDGKRPDDLTYDVTVVDILGNAYLQQCHHQCLCRWEQAQLTHSLNGTHDFFRVALETPGPMSVSTQEFLAQIGRSLTEVATDPRETTFLFQRFSVDHRPTLQRDMPNWHVRNFRARIVIAIME